MRVLVCQKAWPEISQPIKRFFFDKLLKGAAEIDISKYGHQKQNEYQAEGSGQVEQEFEEALHGLGVGDHWRSYTWSFTRRCIGGVFTSHNLNNCNLVMRGKSSNQCGFIWRKGALKK